MCDLRAGAGDCGVTSKINGCVWFYRGEWGMPLGGVWERSPWCSKRTGQGARERQRVREREIITLFNSSGNCNTVAIGDWVCVCAFENVCVGEILQGFLFTFPARPAKTERGSPAAGLPAITESHYHFTFAFSGEPLLLQGWAAVALLSSQFNVNLVSQTRGNYFLSLFF